jgi:hypothetical protein
MHGPLVFHVKQSAFRIEMQKERQTRDCVRRCISHSVVILFDRRRYRSADDLDIVCKYKSGFTVA